MIETMHTLGGVVILGLLLRHAFGVELERPRLSLRDLMPQRFRTDP